MIGAVSPPENHGFPVKYGFLECVCGVKGDFMLSQIHINLNMDNLEMISNHKKRYTNNFKGPQTCAVFPTSVVIPMVPLRQMFD